MTFDMELRGRTEGQSALGVEPGNDHIYELTRVRGGFGVRAPKYFSAYIQFQDAHALGLPLSQTASNMRDTFDLRQGYVKFQDKKLMVIAGRQELKFGDERLIGISDWTNVSRTFDVIDTRIGSEQNRVDLFSGSVVTVFPTSFDNPRGGFNLHGAYGTLKTLIPRTEVDPYVLLRASPPVISQQGIPGQETLVAPGARVVGDIPGGFDYQVEGALERGSYSNDSIHAGAGYVKVGYTAKFLRWHPHIEPEYDYATGNAHRNPDRMSTFFQFYPSNHNVFGLTDLFGWQNITQKRLNFDFRPAKNLYFLLQGESYHVASTNDSVYAGGGTVFVKVPTGGFQSDNIGAEFDASMEYAGPHHFLYEFGVGRFWPGALMKENHHNTDEMLGYFQVRYRFSFSKDGNKAHQSKAGAGGTQTGQ